MNSQRQTIDQQRTRTAKRAALRVGLAPLELVLALPLLLAVMALIVNFAHAATWKVRAATNARLAMWRHRPMWNADSDPKPVNFWPTGASLGVGGGARIGQVDSIWQQPAIAQAWIKGPIFVAGNGYLGVRDNRVNEMGEGVSQGNADATLRYPFMPSMGNMSMSAEHSLMDSVWQFHTMGYGWNEARRAKGWWQLEDSPEWAGLKQVYQTADAQIRQNPQRNLMTPLDRDEDLMRFFGPRNPRSDFYPSPGFCDNDPMRVHDQLVAPGGLLDDIRGSRNPRNPGVCERMASSYLQMYQAELNLLMALPNPPAARMNQLQQWIRELTDFIAKLQ